MKKCKNCKQKFETRFSTLEKYCWNSECKTIEAMEKLEKIKRKQKKDAQQKKRDENKKIKRIKEELKTNSQLRNELQTHFNRWVRLRDRNNGCISCGKKLGAKYDAGHFYSVGNYPSLRFDPNNCHAQCVHCNHHRGGNQHEYRPRLIDKIGQKNFDILYQNRNTPKKYTNYEIRSMIDHYKGLCKILKNK